MARGDDPASATTSFFIVTGVASSLDGKYLAFGRVVDGMAVVEAIEQTPVNGETPVSGSSSGAKDPEVAQVFRLCASAAAKTRRTPCRSVVSCFRLSISVRRAP